MKIFGDEMEDTQVTTSVDGNSRRVMFRWRNRQTIYYAGLAVFLNFVALGVVIDVVVTLATKPHWDWHWLKAAFCLLLCAVAFGFSYHAVALLRNSTTFTFTPDLFTVRHGPLWW